MGLQAGPGSQGGTGEAPASRIGHLPGDRDGPRPGWNMDLQGGPAQGTDGWAGQGCGQLETSPDAASLKQGLAALGS